MKKNFEIENVSKFIRILRRLYYAIFIERFSDRLKLNFTSNYYRWDLIKYLIDKYKYTEYLEIGCNEDLLFSKVEIKDKTGVDPVCGGNVRKTSDDFFKTNKKKFDIVFIDGLHVYEQVKKDILNSVNCLKENGIILVHDCMPDSISKQAVPRYKKLWHGDVWKAIVDLRQRENLEIFTCEIDAGIGIIKKSKNTSILKITKPINKLKFKDYFNNYKKYLRVISLEDLKKII